MKLCFLFSNILEIREQRDGSSSAVSGGAALLTFLFKSQQILTFVLLQFLTDSSAAASVGFRGVGERHSSHGDSQWSVCGKRFDPSEARTVGSDEKNLASDAGLQGWGEVPLPEDLEGAATLKVSHSLMDDDEDFAADEASGDLPSGEDDGSTRGPPSPRAQDPPSLGQKPRNPGPTDRNPGPPDRNTEPSDRNPGPTDRNPGPLTETQNPLTETQDPLTETQDPLTETQNPLTETQALLTETQKPLTETQDPLTETQNPLTETQDPLTETQDLLTETPNRNPGPMTETQNPLTETQDPLTETQDH
ncbi:hypothetical protein F7725_001435 [Dissostichus mawsoni]|uniref:Uncharacterized protein n=1 Tax=Dissostichus mawsoni TaxID=36200 RepID=A0A7J5ZHR5_DISMA|nr:hypothetical protein F7725_001435 [Dissostichus mawsoni]